uniref:Uncharacterized protein n=1 Tax=Nelumbo nucifera TaxID=4432 RepID=A0A822XXQ0_NELNU|nr:TPA_asm: hypothetical protein HUJ06_026551 [Nelumbo nucifera]
MGISRVYGGNLCYVLSSVVYMFFGSRFLHPNTYRCINELNILLLVVSEVLLTIYIKVKEELLP